MMKEGRKEEGKESVFFSLLAVSLCEKFMLPSHEPLAAEIQQHAFARNADHGTFR